MPLISQPLLPTKTPAQPAGLWRTATNWKLQSLVHISHPAAMSPRSVGAFFFSGNSDTGP
jgi:hypothetical protein